MKLRIKFTGRKDKVDVGDAPTITSVKEIVSQHFAHHAADFELSLNGRDPLEGEPDTPLSDFAIVSGDLLHVIVTGGAVDESLGVGSQESRPVATTTARASPNLAPPSSSGMATDADSNQGNVGVEHNTDRAKHGAPSTSPPSMSGAGPREGGANDGGASSGVAAEVDLVSSAGEPMLCRSATDCAVPQRLRALCAENKPQSPDEALCVVLHVLMLETGFYTELPRECLPSPSRDSAIDCNPSPSTKKSPAAPSIDGDISSDTRASMPPNWRATGHFRLMSYRHLSCEDTACSVTCTPVGNVMAVHGATSGKARFSLKLKSRDYVTAMNDKQPAFNNLPELSRLFKDSIAYPLLQTTRAELGLVPLNGLQALFPEIQLLILSFLDVRSLLCVSEVGRHFRSMASDRLLWRQLLLRDFGCRETDSNLDWRELYKRKYKNKKDLERYRRNLMDRSLPVTPGMFYPPPPLLPTMPGYPPGYRGGDYDLDPFAGLAPSPLGIPLRRDPTVVPFPGAGPAPDRSPLRDPVLNPLPRVPSRRDPLGYGRPGGGSRGFRF